MSRLLVRQGVPTQGTVYFRARLKLRDAPKLPITEAHNYIGKQLPASYYPIANGHCVWTLGVPQAALEAAGLTHKPPNARRKARAQGSDADDARGLARQRAAAGQETLEVRCCLLAKHISSLALCYSHCLLW